jgi:hypothetical protein
MLVTLVLGHQGIEGKARVSGLPDAQGFIDKLRTVGTQPGFLTQFFSDALGRLENRMEVIVNDEFSAAEFQHVGMYLPLDERLP